MSRFFNHSEDSDFSEDQTSESSDSSLDSDASSEASDSSDSGSESYSENEQTEQSKKSGINRFLGSDDSDDDSDDDTVRRVVKSAKDKKIEEIEASAKIIENAEKISDWVTITNELEKLSKLCLHVAKNNSNEPPRIYFKILVLLEDSLNEAQQTVAKKKLSALNAKAFNTLRQRVRKTVRSYSDQVEAWRVNPTLGENLLSSQGSTAIAQSKQADGQQSVTDSVSSLNLSKLSVEDRDGFETIGKGGRVEKLNPADIFKTLRTISEARGKKNTDRPEQVRVLEKLLEVAANPFQSLHILIALMAARFDFITGIQNTIPVEQWVAAKDNLHKILSILETEPNYLISDDAEEMHDDDSPEPDLTATNGPIKILGNLVSLIERLDDELNRQLQSTDPHTQEYIDRLKLEIDLYDLMIRIQCYHEKVGASDSLIRCMIRRLDHLYYKPENIISVFEEHAWKSLPESIDSSITPRDAKSNSSQLIHKLVSYIFKNVKNDTGILRYRALLSEIFHLALLDRFYEARDMMLMSHIQDTIHMADISTQVLYNRATVQLGLCAFRSGLIAPAQSCLHEICNSGRLRELLAQGVQPQRFASIPAEQERIEKQRQLPFHMHINLEHIEAAYLTSSMLLEIPAIAAANFSPQEYSKKRPISRIFRRLLDVSERQIFLGKPETMRDHVMAAAKALSRGQWKQCRDLICSITIWDLLPKVQEFKASISSIIQETALRTYLVTFDAYYDSLSLTSLCDLFDMPEKRVLSIVSKMIAMEEINAAFDQKHQCIVFQRMDTTKIQNLSMILAERANQLLESNEKVAEKQQTIYFGYANAPRNAHASS